MGESEPDAQRLSCQGLQLSLASYVPVSVFFVDDNENDDENDEILMSHYACETVALLQHESPDFIFSDQWPPNSLDLNPVDHRRRSRYASYATGVAAVKVIRQGYVLA